MPYLPSSARAQVRAERAEITLSVDKRTAKTGERVTFSGRVSGVALPTAVYIQGYIDGAWTDLWGPIATDSQGNFSYTATMPHEWGCRDIRFRAVHRETGGVSNEVSVAVAYETAIELNVPERVTVNTPFTVSGRLVYFKAPDTPEPLPNKQVKILLDGVTYDTVTTGSDGSFSIDMVIDVPGDHIVEAWFEGQGFPAVVRVLGMEAEVTPIVNVLRGIASAIPIIVTGGMIVLSELKKRGVV